MEHYMDAPHSDQALVVVALQRRIAELEDYNHELAERFAVFAAERAQWSRDQDVQATIMPSAQQSAYRLALEEERGRIAMEIHDSVAQQLYGIVYTINACLKLLPSQVDLVQEQLEQLLPTAQRATVALRRAIFDLWPDELDTLRFTTELRGYVEEIAPTSNLQLYVQIDQGFSTLPMVMRRQLYRIAQEALNNVIVHANAKRAKITLVRNSGDVRLRVADDGCGFAEEPPVPPPGMARHLGLTSMRERAALLNGRLEIDSLPGQGTTLTAIVPIGTR
jgi:signal transduction histidine kinase